MFSRSTHHHQAMATTFKVVIVGSDPVYARQAAAAAFAELDRLENLLSRHVENSDLARIHRLRAGQTTVVAPDTFECLSIALDIQAATGGAFDVAYGSATPIGSEPRFELDAVRHTVRVRADGVRLDLGGIGKGLALDRMAGLLQEWDLPSALLAASTSTLLALAAPAGERGWLVHIGPDHAPRKLLLTHRAISGSGTAVRGSHIIDPQTQRPADRRCRAWAAAPTGAVADALSTAFMILDAADIRAYCERHPGVAAYLQPTPTSDLLPLADP
jgi:thiamine biosynthesis lipoprotein